MLKRLIPSLVVIAIAAVVALYGQRLADTVLARFFVPSQRIAAIDQRLALTDRGTDLLYASHTSVEDSSTFNASCQSTERTAAILGCYYRRQIFLYNVQNPELDGAIEVTAAHEMLHAAYDRLNFFERKHVDDLITAEYDTLKKDPVIAKEMEYYSKAEPGAEVNELHSIIGTTVASVSPELESYYTQYFTDRQKIVALNQKYNAVFSDITAQAEQLQKEIDQEEIALKGDLKQYEAERSQLETDIQTFNERASGQGFGSQSSFNAARSSLVTRVNEMNQRRDDINSRVANYNEKIAELAKLSVKVNEINKSLNGVPAPTGV